MLEKRWGKSRACVFAVVFGACLLGGCVEEPEIRLADGSTGNWDQWQGRWMLINYWAEWCAPCREEIPELNRLHEDGVDGQLVVLGVNFDGLSGEALSDLVERMDIEFPVLLDDPKARWQQPMPGVLPSTLVIDPDGELRTVLVGPQTFESLSRAVQVTSAM